MKKSFLLAGVVCSMLSLASIKAEEPKKDEDRLLSASEQREKIDRELEEVTEYVKKLVQSEELESESDSQEKQS